MTFTLPPGIAILGNGDNLLLPPGMTDEDRECLAGAIAALSDEIAEMMMPVHDELVFEVPTGSVDAIRTAVEATMVAAAAGVLGTSIPVVVKTSVSQTWSDK